MAYGRYVLDASPGLALAWDIRDLFAWYLDQWSAATRDAEIVQWSQDLTCDEVKYLLHGFHRLVLDVEATVARHELQPCPAQALAFYRALVRALLDAVATDSDACAAWAEELGSFWPGVDAVERWAPPAVRS